MTEALAKPLISIVVPVLDEEDCVAELIRRVESAVLSCEARLEMIFVDDGSTDRTFEILCEEQERRGFIKALRLTRSFGHQAALAAGFERARGDAVITMDGDLQHPPESLPELIEAWRGGASVVHTVRREKDQKPGFFKQATARLFYRLFDRLTAVPIVHGGADFRLLDRRVVDELRDLPEHFLFLRGLVPWLGFPSATVDYEVAQRFAGTPKYRLRKMLRLALNGIFSFSVVPLRGITILGFTTTLFGALYGVFAVIAFLAGNLVEPGWTSLMVIVLLFGGVQLLSIGIVSEYLGRVYEEVKRRPRFIVRSTLGFAEERPENAAEPPPSA